MAVVHISFNESNDAEQGSGGNGCRRASLLTFDKITNNNTFNMKLRHNKVATLAATLITYGSFAGGASAATISLSENGLNRLEVLFTVPAQPASHNALSIGVLSSSGSSNFSSAATLFDGVVVLGQSLTTGIGGRYATVGSAFSGVDPIIDYSSIEDGTISGRFIMDVISGSRSFESSDVIVRPFGDGGSFPGFEGTVTSVQASTVPEPSSAALLGLGCLSLTLRRSRRY